MKTIRLNENQFNSVFLIESMGVPNNAQEIAMDIINELFEYLDYIEENIASLKAEYTDEEEEDDTAWGYFSTTSWEDEFSYDFIVSSYNDYHVELFYDSRGNKKADTDRDGEITINFYYIQRIIEKCGNRTKLIKGVNSNELIKNEIIDYLSPVLVHELTHDTDESEHNHDYLWLGSHHELNEGDLREILYLFSDIEINARVASAAAIMENCLTQLFVTDAFENGNEFYSFVNDYIIDESEQELHLKHMSTLLDIIGLDYNSNKKYIRQNKEERTQPYSLAYDLFLNDTRLKNNRTLKRLFNQNYVAGKEYVVNFYKKKLEDYKKRIFRACWYAYQKHIGSLTTEGKVNEITIDGHDEMAINKYIKNGYLVHGTSANTIDSFDEEQISGGFRAIYGYGAYFTDAAYKALEYGNEIHLTKKDIYNFFDLDKKCNIHEFESVYTVDADLYQAKERLYDARNNKEYDYYTKLVEDLERKQLSSFESMIFDLFVKAIKENDGYAYENVFKYVNGSLPSGSDKKISKLFLHLGFDGFKCGNQYVIFNFEKLNNNLVSNLELE